MSNDRQLYTVGWGNEEKTYVRNELMGTPSEEEFRQMLRQVISHVDSVDHRVDILTVDRGNHFYKLQFLQIAFSERSTTGNQRYFVMVGTPHYVTKFVSVITKVLPIIPFEEILFFSTEEKALDFLSQHRSA